VLVEFTREPLICPVGRSRDPVAASNHRYHDIGAPLDSQERKALQYSSFYTLSLACLYHPITVVASSKEWDLMPCIATMFVQQCTGTSSAWELLKTLCSRQPQSGVVMTDPRPFLKSRKKTCKIGAVASLGVGVCKDQARPAASCHLGPGNTRNLPAGVKEQQAGCGSGSSRNPFGFLPQQVEVELLNRASASSPRFYV
jgi:hypothetical protein